MRRLVRLVVSNQVRVGLLAAGVVIAGRLLDAHYLSTLNVQANVDALFGPLVVGFGVTVALLAGIVDLSIGATVGLGATVFAIALDHGLALPAAVVCAAAAGILVGLTNAAVAVHFNVEPVVATLATMIGVPGLVSVLDDSRSMPAFSSTLSDIVDWRMGPVPVLLLLAMGLYGLLFLCLCRTRLGQHLIATGADRHSARLKGVEVNRIRTVALCTSGGFAALAGVVHAGQLGAAPNNLGSATTFVVFAGIILGGFDLFRGGVGNPIGAASGIVALGLFDHLLRQQQVNTSWTNIVTGGLLIVLTARWVSRPGGAGTRRRHTTSRGEAPVMAS